MKTLYISDLDGTLLNDSTELSEYTVQTLNRLIADGMNFTVATARSAYSACKVLEKLNLRLPMILSGGVMLYDPETRVFSNVKYIPPDASAAALAAIRRYGLPALLYALDGAEQNIYYEPALENAVMKDFREGRLSRYGKRFTPVSRLEELPAGGVCHIELMDTRPRLKPLYEELRRLGGLSGELYRNTYTENAWIADICSAKASKGDAALELKKLGGFDRLVGFGDNLNDLPLFAVCDERYAVANAQDEVRAAATEIIGANIDDGVARRLDDAVALGKICL
ncbi:MAG: HAD family hydrolase [Oscillospiraceae bacterium]|jgi:Cof subfamily protein (haloacid dehalogenase superfamily)|nr:HAD family hydrolase [Oscillospiraceae bacterium]